MTRIVEILVAVNAIAGISAFLIARNAVKRVRNAFKDDDEPKDGP